MIRLAYNFGAIIWYMLIHDWYYYYYLYLRIVQCML